MAKEVNLLGYWMPLLRGIKEFQEVANADTPEFRLLLEAVDKTLNNMFIATADEDGVKRLEKVAGIYPLEGDTLEVRKYNLLSVWAYNAPYTRISLDEYLNTICGDGMYEIEYNESLYKISIGAWVNDPSFFDILFNTLRNMIPANMNVEFYQLFNSYEVLSQYPHIVLAWFTHDELYGTKFWKELSNAPEEIGKYTVDEIEGLDSAYTVEFIDEYGLRKK